MGLDILGQICRIQEGRVHQQLERCGGFGGLMTIGTLEDIVHGQNFFPQVKNAVSYLECRFRICVLLA